MTQSIQDATGSSTSRHDKSLAHEELDQARRWRAAGWPVIVISQRMNRSTTTIRAYLNGIRFPDAAKDASPGLTPSPRSPTTSASG